MSTVDVGKRDQDLGVQVERVRSLDELERLERDGLGRLELTTAGESDRLGEIASSTIPRSARTRANCGTTQDR